jgi:hypothetical protein
LTTKDHKGFLPLHLSLVLGIVLIIVSVVLQTWSKVRVKNPA